MQKIDNLIQMLTIPADSGGCSHYRLHFPYWCIRSATNKVVKTETMRYVWDPNFFRGIKVVQVQRFIDDNHLNYLKNFLSPLGKSFGFWLHYEIDDVIYKDDIPPYNRGRKPYQNDKMMENLKEILSLVDIITVTTENLKNYYASRFNIDKNKILVIPNYLPRWWVGETFEQYRIKNRFNENKKKRKIVLPLSISHYDVENMNGGIDDISALIPFIRSTVNKYEWHFLGGGFPRQLQDLLKMKKVFYHVGSDILNYPREMFQGKYDCIVAPLIDNIFNRCKSNIKLIEGWGLGIPVIAQDICTYNKYTEWTFKDNNKLQNQLDKLFKDGNKYLKVVKQNRSIVDFGDKNSPNGWWLEKNINKWIEAFNLPQKTLEINFNELAGNVPQQKEDDLILKLK